MNLVDIQTGYTLHLQLAFITTGNGAGKRVQQRGMSKSEMGLQSSWSGGMGDMGSNREDGDQRSGLGIWSSKTDQRGKRNKGLGNENRTRGK